MRFRTLLWIGILWVGLTGCRPYIEQTQSSQTELINLDAQHPIGQTFVARYDGLSAVQIYLSPVQAGDGQVKLRLLAEPGAEQNFQEVVMPVLQVTEAKTYRFDFPRLVDSSQQYYYAQFDVVGDGILGVGASAEATFQDGAMYQQGIARDGQLMFSLQYEPGPMVSGLAMDLMRWAGILGLSGLLFITPGWAVLGWLWRGWDKLTWLDRIGLAGGFSLSTYPVIFVLTDLVGLHLGIWNAWGVVSISIVSLIAQAIKKIPKQRNNSGTFIHSLKVNLSWSARLANITVIVVLGLIMITRWWAVRSIEAPMWGDSVQHTFIAQLILDHGGLFQSWEPYSPYSTYSNQFGFPASAALLSWTSGLDVNQAVLWSGQVLNVLAVLVLYPLAVKLAKGERWAGVGGVFAAGLIFSMPAFYFNWGRYAQLTGQVILPVVIWMTWDVIQDPPISQESFSLRSLPWGKMCLMGVAISGMMMAQYRMPFFYLTFVLACLVGWWIPAWWFNRWLWLNTIVRLGLVALIGALLFLPWGVNMLMGNLRQVAVSDASPEILKANLPIAYQEWTNVSQYLPIGLVWIILGGWLWGLLRKEWLVIVIGLWIPWLASVYAWSVLGVPGSLQVAPFAVLISLYIPAGILFGWLVAQITSLLKRWLLVEVLLVIIGVILGSWFAWQQRDIAEPQTYAMVTRPDLRAMDWIRENTDPKARFLVEGFRAFYNTAAVGSDAGWWLPLLSGRDNTMPPLYALSSEVPFEEGYSTQLIDLVASLETIPLNTPEGLALLCENNISHVYIGQLQGLVGISWLSQSYSDDELINQPYYQLIYHQDRVYIFALSEDACNE